MPKTPEGEVRKWLVKELKKEFGAKVFIQINHQSRYTVRGIPDVTICALGVVVWIELKSAGNEPTVLQWKKIHEIREANGMALYIDGKDERKLSLLKRHIYRHKKN